MNINFPDDSMLNVALYDKDAIGLLLSINKFILK
jgi:hypothetical protein